jgi:tRNA(fMet)-specific endonuclease VapC
MRRYLLDTGVAGDFIARRRGVDGRVRDAGIQGDIVGICVPVLAELWAGIELSATRDRNIERMRHSLSRLRIWPFDVRSSQEYGRIFAALYRSGRIIQRIDIQIAAIALSLGNCTVVTTDTDFSAVPGLDIESWQS